MRKAIFSIDVGSEVSGVALISLENGIEYASVLDNHLIIDKITNIMLNRKIIVVIEDIRPFKMGMAMQTIETAKFIGELKYRLKSELQVEFELFPRFDVKRFVFDRFQDLCLERIGKKIAYLDDIGERSGRKRYRKKTGELYKATMHYVDDRIVIAAMKEYWGIETPKPGKSNKYGLKSHSWQALALGTFYLATHLENGV